MALQRKSYMSSSQSGLGYETTTTDVLLHHMHGYADHMDVSFDSVEAKWLVDHIKGAPREKTGPAVCPVVEPKGVTRNAMQSLRPQPLRTSLAV